jgi:hypothetical protein
MKTAKLLGYSKVYTNEGENSDGHEESETVFKFYIELDECTYYFTATESFGSCGSGYSSASYGDIDFTLNEDYITHKLTTPNKEIFINIVDNQLVKTVLDPTESWDATITCVKNTEGEIIVSSTGDGGCQYYSSGK